MSATKTKKTTKTRKPATANRWRILLQSMLRRKAPAKPRSNIPRPDHGR
jgi:hypothetical protein